jgi:hypothetical protein
MSQGDFTWFNAAKHKLGLAVVNLETDVLKLGLITDAVTPAADTANPCWGAGGTTNLSSSQVTPGGNYASGGPTVANNTFTESSGTVTLDGDAVSIAQNASNPTDARWGVLYSDTATAKDALGFLDLGGVTDLSAGGFSATPNAAGIMTLA